MRQSLKTASLDYFTSFQLDEDVTTDLCNQINQPAEKAVRFYRKQILAGFLAGIFLAVIVNLVFNRAVVDPLMQIAEEVSANHLHRDPLEINSTDFSEVQHYFADLDFDIRPSVYYASNDNVLGGRYCSLKGLTAAQIRLKTSSQPATLYQVAYDQKVFGDLPDLDRGEEPAVRYADGVMVKIWVEKGLLMSSAEDLSQ